jgi:DNA-3-methyladenine glycosylase
VEPLAGLELMGQRRGVDPASLRLLARGPARLAQAFGIDRSLDGSDLVAGPVWIGGPQMLRGDVVAGPRIGITKAAAEPWRFSEAGPWAGPLRSAPLKAANMLGP